MWMWKVEWVEVLDAEIKLNALSSNGWEITPTHISDGDRREPPRLISNATRLRT